MNCRACIAELVECARAGLLPGARLQDHLRECPPCRERWEGERALSAQFRKMRGAVLARRKPDSQRGQIMRAFERARPRALRPPLRWTLGMAAALLLAVAAGQVWQSSPQLTDSKKPASGASQESANSPAGRTGKSAVGPSGVPGWSELISSDDFVAVPYVPPLATGEFVRVVRTELRPTALARLGIYVDTTDADELSADVLLGEDGFPRGVRVLEAGDF